MNSGLNAAAHRGHHLFLGATGTQVGGQDQDRVAEVDRAALAVGQPALVEHLQQHVEHVRVRLLDLVEQDHRVRTPAHGLGQLTTLVVADVPRRRTDQTGHRMLLAVLAHVDADHRALVVEQELRQRFRELGLTDTGRAQEHERTRRPVGVGHPGAAAAHRIRHRGHRRLLADDALAQLLLHAQQLGGLAFEHPAGRECRSTPRPRRRCRRGRPPPSSITFSRASATRQRGVELLLDLGDTPVAQLRGLGQVAVALGPVGLTAQGVQLLLVVRGRCRWRPSRSANEW